MGAGGLRPHLLSWGGAAALALVGVPAWGMQPCPDDEGASRAAAIATLDAPLDPSDPEAYRSRIFAVRDRGLRCPGESPVPALFRVFLRSRYGVPTTSGPLTPLPEDPDLFEGALWTLRHLIPPEQVAAGAAEGLGAGLVELTWSKLRHDWLDPATSGLSASDRSIVAQWQPKASSSHAADALVALVQADPDAALFAMTTGGGSLAHEVVRPIQDDLLSAFLLDQQHHPSLVRAVAGVVADAGIAGPGVHDALAHVHGPDTDTAEALVRAREVAASATDWPPLRIPPSPPGRVAGLQALRGTDLDPFDYVRVEGDQPALSSAWQRTLLGLCMMLGAMGVGLGRRHRRIAGIVFGFGVCVFSDGLLDACRLAPAQAAHPIFQFIAQSTVQVHPHPAQPEMVWLGGGSMRHTVMRRDPDAEHPRVAFLGASSMHGSHFVRDDTLPEQVLKAGYSIQPVNLGIGGTTSAGVADAGRAALSLGARVLVVMYGHNEVAQFSRLAVYQHTQPAQLRARLWLGHSAWYRLLTLPLVQKKSPTAPPADLYRSTAPRRAEIADLTELAVIHLEQQIGSLLSDARQQGVPAILVVPPTNLRFAHLQPFDSPGPGDATDLQRLREAAEEAARAGDAATARNHLQAAIDRSASPRELVTPVRRALERLGRQNGATVVDAQAWMCAHAPDGVTPSGFFWDDVHPTPEGHAALARLVGPVLDQRLAESDD